MQTFNYGAEIFAEHQAFYPIHMTPEQLAYIADCVVNDIQKDNVINISVRKTEETGVLFEFVCGKNSNLTNSENVSRKYTVNISPNWDVRIFDHWTTFGGNVKRNQLIDNGSVALNGIICDNILSKINISVKSAVNPIFLKDEWVVVRKIKDTVLI